MLKVIRYLPWKSREKIILKRKLLLLVSREIKRVSQFLQFSNYFCAHLLLFIKECDDINIQQITKMIESYVMISTLKSNGMDTKSHFIY